ncbi:MAG TPA: hypothetical protein VJV03_12725, partial [Pyrinomonadaceae bacterium]|nr:hypothetical protein [Pyrinomonadaceae bacterium]
HGERDEFGDVESLRRIVEMIPADKAELHVVSKADHFFGGKLDELKRVITEWVTRQLNPAKKAEPGSQRPGRVE